jgi:putative flippase GtrA
MVVGLISNFSGYLIYLLLTHFGSTPKLTVTLLYGTGATIGFFGNKQYTFHYSHSYLRAVVRYIIAHLFGYLINLTMLIIFVDKMGYNHRWVQGISVFLVAGYLFLVFRFYVFKKEKPV